MTDGPESYTHDGFRYLLEPSSARFLKKRVIPDLDTIERMPGVTLIKRNSVRTVFRVPMKESVVFLKRYHVRTFFDRMKYLVVPSRAMTEWLAARTMTAAGLPTIHAVMMGEKRSGRILLDGTLATIEIPDANDLVPVLHWRLREPGLKAARRRLLRDLAELIRRFHDAGFVHNDLHSGNILVTGEPETAKLHLIDLHTVKIVAKTSRRSRIANLSKMLHSLVTGTTRSERRRILSEYEGDDPVLGDIETVSRKIFGRIYALERRRLKSRARRCLRSSSSFDLARVGEYSLWFRRDIPPAGVLLAIGDHLLSMRKGGRDVLKDSRRSAISRQILAGPLLWGRTVVKETRIPEALEILKNAFRDSRGMASWKNGNGLDLHQVRVGRPVALAVKGRWPLIRESYLLMEDLSECTRLDLYVLKRFAGELDAAGRREKRDFVRRLAHFVRRLHRKGIYHGDLKAVNMFVKPSELGNPIFFLVDYDRVTFGDSVSPRRRIKNLAQLAASVAVLITKTDRMRFFREWAPDPEALEAMRSINAGVEKALSRKIVVEMEPIE